MAAPRRIPIATRPEGPIRLLSNAYLRKKETATIKARMPIRLSQRPAIRPSRSAGATFACVEDGSSRGLSLRLAGRVDPRASRGGAIVVGTADGGELAAGGIVCAGVGCGPASGAGEADSDGESARDPPKF